MMDQRVQPTHRSTIAIGAVFAAAGGYFTLVGLGVLPIPGGPRNLHGPLWIVLCVGLAFLLGGLAVLLQAVGKAAPDGSLPASAPRWLHVAQYVLMLAIFACFAAIGTWVAFGGGPRSFRVSIPFIGSGGAGEMIGRTAFGIGAAITWACLIAVAVSGARKLLRR